jgi:signal transduction histidine kinase
MINKDRFDGQSPFQALERDRRRRLLITASIILAVATTLLMAFYVVMLIFQPSRAFIINVSQSLLAVIVSLLVHRMARNGRLDLGSWILLIFLLLNATYGGLTQGGSTPLIALAYVIVIVLGSTLLGPPGDLIITIASAIAWLGQVVAQEAGLIQTPQDTGIVGTISTVGLTMAVFFFTAIINRATIRTVQRALGDATYELIQANRKLEEANRMKSQFMARMSHELRTPLNAITGYTDLALREIYGPLSKEMEDSQGRVLRNAKRLQDLINDLLDLSKIEAGQLKLVEAAFPVSHLVEAVQVALGPRAANKGLILSAILAPDMPSHIIGDETRLTQILTNLADNAIKFTDQGSVSILIEPIGTEQWRIEVRDTGHGILEEDYERIFDEFQQVGPTTDARRGTGLGLAIVQHLARLMDGKVRVNSQIGKGSIFEVVLPLKVAETAPTGP